VQIDFCDCDLYIILFFIVWPDVSDVLLAGPYNLYSFFMLILCGLLNH